MDRDGDRDAFDAQGGADLCFFSPFLSLLSLLLLHFLSLVLPLFFMIEREGESEEWLSG
jgi:hypothetical protein